MRKGLLAGVLIAVAACGGGGTKAPVTTSAAPPTTNAGTRSTSAGPASSAQASKKGTVSAQIAVTGARPVTGSYSRQLSDLYTPTGEQSCAGYVTNSRNTFDVPDPKDKVSGMDVTVQAGIGGYKGPGKYPGAANDESTYVSVTKDQGDEMAVFAFSTKAGSTTDAEVKTDGSGTFTFTKFENANGDFISGSVTWTCSA